MENLYPTFHQPEATEASLDSLMSKLLVLTEGIANQISVASAKTIADQETARERTREDKDIIF